MKLQSKLLDSNPVLKEQIDELIVLGSLMGYHIRLAHHILGVRPGLDLLFSQPIDVTSKYISIRLVFYHEGNRFMNLCRVESNFFNYIQARESWEEVLVALQKAKEML